MKDCSRQVERLKAALQRAKEREAADLEEIRLLDAGFRNAYRARLELAQIVGRDRDACWWGVFQATMVAYQRRKDRLIAAGYSVADLLEIEQQEAIACGIMQDDSTEPDMNPVEVA